MYTPDEIRNIEFTKSMGGYKTAEVDVFIDRCADTVAALYNEKAELSKKLEVLADKLVEYRNEEDSIRTALLSAQRLGDTVVREANHKAGLILEDANIKAEKVLETAKRSITTEEEELRRIQKEVSLFKSRMLSIYREHLSLIDVLPEEPKEEKKPEEPAPSAPSVPAAQETVQQPVPPAAPMPAPAPVPAVPAVPQAFEPVETPAAVYQPAPAEVKSGFVVNIPELDEEESAPIPAAAAPVAPAEPPAVSRFANLKFGEEYDITKDDSEPKGFFRRKK